MRCNIQVAYLPWLHEATYDYLWETGNDNEINVVAITKYR